MSNETNDDGVSLCENSYCPVSSENPLAEDVDNFVKKEYKKDQNNSTNSTENDDKKKNNKNNQPTNLIPGYLNRDNPQPFKLEKSKNFILKSVFFSGSLQFATMQNKIKTSTPKKDEEKKDGFLPNSIFERNPTESPSALIFTIIINDKILYAAYQNRETNEFYIITFKLQKVNNQNKPFRGFFFPYLSNQEIINDFIELLSIFGLTWENFENSTKKKKNKYNNGPNF